jgi:uncharacterized membrane protein YeaQ/YmgE (transglycosylase-associated protein family)
MTLIHFFVLLLVAGIAGAVGKALAGSSPGGLLTSIALGFVGALLGSWTAGLLGLPDFLVIVIGSQSFPLIWSIFGAALFVGILGLLHQARPRTEGTR